MKRIFAILASFFTIFLFLFSSNFVFGDQAELDEINRQLNELTTAYNQAKAATAPLER